MRIPSRCGQENLLLRIYTAHTTLFEEEVLSFELQIPSHSAGTRIYVRHQVQSQCLHGVRGIRDLGVVCNADPPLPSAVSPLSQPGVDGIQLEHVDIMFRNSTKSGRGEVAAGLMPLNRRGRGCGRI